MRKDRTSNLMEVEFELNGKKDTVDVWIPFDIYVEAIRKLCDYKMVGIDGTDNSIWNLFVELGCIDDFADNDDFIDICKDLYKGTSYEEDDYDEWKSYMEEDE